MEAADGLPESGEAVFRERTGGLSANALKLIAIVAMTVDHIAAYFLEYDRPLYIWMRTVGRITGPTMFFLVAEGYRRTRNRNRYTLRLAAFAAISYIPYLYAHTGRLWPDAASWMQLNVIYTILLGLLGIRVRNEWHSPAAKVAALVGLAYLAWLGDWGVLGFLIMLAFDYCHGEFRRQAVAYCLLILTYGGLLRTMMIPMNVWVHGAVVDYGQVIPGLYDFGMVLPILLLARYNGRRGPGGAAAKWAFYVYYPLHLLVIGLLKYAG